MRSSLLILLFPYFLSAQPQFQWQKKITSDSLAIFKTILPTSDGNFLLTGYEIDAHNSPIKNPKFMKINPNGEVIWEKFIAKDKSATVNCLTYDAQQNLLGIVNEFEQSGQKEVRKSYLKKWDENGNILLEKPIPAPYLLLSPLQMLPSGEFLIGLQEEQKITDSTSNYLYGMAKLSANGDILWTKTYTAPKNRRFAETSFSLLANNEIVFAASIALRPDSIDWRHYIESDTQNLCLIYCKENGEEINRKTFPAIRHIAEIKTLSDGNLLVLGTLYDAKEEDSDISIRKIAAKTGDLLWETTQHIQRNDHIFTAKELSDKHLLISAVGNGSWVTNTRYNSLLELDEKGKVLWTKVFRDGNLIFDAYKKQDKGFLCVGAFAEKYVYQDEDAPRKKTDEKHEALLLSLTQNACIWEKTFALPSQEQPYCLKKAKDGGYFIAGIDFISSYTSSIFVLKVTEEGEPLWREDLGSWKASMEVPVSVAPTKEGGCVAITNSDEIIKISKDGDYEWELNRHTFKHLSAIVATKEGDFLLAGTSWGEYPNRNFLVSKMSPKGKPIWQKEYAKEVPGEIWDMAITAEGDCIIAADAGKIGETKMQLTYIPKNKDNFLWQTSYETREKAETRSVAVLKDGGFAIAGISYAKGDKYKASIIKTDKKGQKEWGLDLVKSDNDVAATAITSDSTDNILFAATHKFNGYKGEQEIYLAKINLQGKILWEKYIGGANTHAFGGICLTPDNQILIVGYTDYQHHLHDSQVYLVKVRNE